MKDNNEEKKKLIIKWLKEFKRLSTSRIGGLLGMNYDSVKNILDEMTKEKRIIEEKETNASYYVIKGEKING
ncbi:MAG: hypothetical protein AABY22_01580 [Nanoarchaeota archaeon]